MRTLFIHTPTLVWLVLSVATALSWWLGADHGSDASVSLQQTTIALMLLAFFKVRLVIMHFMEVGNAPLPLRLICEGWVVVVCAAVIGAYLILPLS